MYTTVSVLADLAAAIPQPVAVKTLPEVIAGITGWIMGILAAIATMFLVIGFILYMSAGDPAQAEQAKGYFKRALFGYAGAVLAPVILQILQGILGG